MPKRVYRFWVYILTNSTNHVVYVWLTNDLCRRMFEHQQGIFDNAFTKRYNLNKLVFYQEFQYINLAIQRENQLKEWNRSWKDNLIEAGNPLWEDLSSTLTNHSKEYM